MKKIEVHGRLTFAKAFLLYCPRQFIQVAWGEQMRGSARRPWVRLILVATFTTSLVLQALTLSAQAPAPLSVPNVPLVVGGEVLAIAVQPDGSIIVGGKFESVNGVLRRNLAKITLSGVVDPDWNPAPNDIVRVVAVNENTAEVYVAGQFNSIGGQSLFNLAKLAGKGHGTPDPAWNPAPRGGVSALAIDASGSVYVGGTFWAIGGHQRNWLAKISGTGNGELDTSWDPAPNSSVNAILPGPEGTLLIAGNFTAIGNEERYYLAKVSMAGAGALDLHWNPAPAGFVLALAKDDKSSLFFSGLFDAVGGHDRQGLAKVSINGTAAIDPEWHPQLNGGAATSVAVDTTGSVYIGGYFSSVGGTQLRHLAKVSGMGRGDPDPSWNPNPNGVVETLAIGHGDRLHAGGAFNQMDEMPRLGLATIDAEGGIHPAIDVERPANVHHLLPTPDGGLIVAGDFLKGGNLSRHGLLRITPAGEVDPDWDPSPRGLPPWSSSIISAIASDSATGSIFIGGIFTHIGGQQRRYLAKFTNDGTGSIDPDWNPNPDDWVAALAVDKDGSVLVGGGFTSISGQPRQHIAKLAGTGSGVADPLWNPNAGGDVYSLALHEDGNVYVGGSFIHIGGVAHAYLAKIEGNGTGMADSSWNPAPNGNVYRLALSSGGDVYAIGEFFSIGGQPRAGIAKLVGNTGIADPDWNPGIWHVFASSLAVDAIGDVYVGGLFPSGIGGLQRSYLAKLSGNGSGAADPNWHPMPDDAVDTIAVSPGGTIFVGGRFTRIGTHARTGFAALPPATIEAIFADGFEAR